MANRRNGKSEPRSLRKMVIGALGITFLCFIIIVTTVFYVNMTGMLEHVESEHMLEVGAIVRDVVTANLENMRSRTRTWSSWDDTYEYAKTGDGSFLESSIRDGTALTVQDMDYVIIKDLDGNDLFAGCRPGVKDDELPNGLSERIGNISAEVLSHPTTKSYVVYEYCDTGFVVVDNNSYMICVAPILTTDESSDPAGTFTFVKHFGSEQFEEFTLMYDTIISFTEQNSKIIVKESFVTVQDRNTISLTTYVENLNNERGSVLRFYMPRTLYKMGRGVIVLVSAVMGLLLLGVMAVLFVVLDRYLLRPVARLKSDLSKIDQNEKINPEDYGQYLELHLLSYTVNDALERLEQSHRRARQSEISLGTVTNILNGLDAFLYVTDPETDKILFMNDLMKTHYSIEGDPVGEVCWRILQTGKSDRCEFCPCYALEKEPDRVVVWEMHSDVTGRIYRNTDTIIEWVGGKKAHLQYVEDITEERAAEESLKRRLSQQSLMSDLSQNFLIGDDLDEQIDRALEIAGEFMDIGRVLLGSYKAEGRSFKGTNQWLSPKQSLRSYLGEVIDIDGRDSALLDGLINRKIHILNSDEECGRLAVQYEDVDSYLIAPLYVSGKLWGVLDVRGSKTGHWTESDVSLVLLAAGIISVAIDRRLLEMQFRSISSIVQYSPEFIYYMDKDARLTYVNPAVLPFTGYGKKEIMEKGLHALFGEDMFAQIRDEIIPETLKNSTNQFEAEMIHKSGERRFVSTSTFVIGDGSGYVGGIASDVTMTRRLEHELIAAKELAEQGNRAKSEFLSRMSHEMRTPMNAIIGMTNIAKSSEDIKKKEYCLDKIEDASLHLLGVINDVLDMSKIEADKFELSPAEFRFDHMLTNVINVIGFRMDEKSQTMSLMVDPGIPSSLIGDEQRLGQVIINLMSNAVKFTPENGNIGLSFNLLEDRGSDLHLEVEVCDDGIGISPEQQARLFRSFEQADNSTARKFGGTGLGLVISRRIVQLMGGDIRVESELGEGAKFIFDIHVDRGTEGLLETGKRKFAGKDLNILMVDDSPETCDYFRYVMDSFRIPCQTVHSGAQALEAVKSSEKPFGLIFVDWKMPEMNGIELTREIRRLKESDPVVVMISASEWSDIESEALEAGVDGFVAKPLFPSLIMDCINKYAGTRSELVYEAATTPEQYFDAGGGYSFAGKVILLAEDVDVNREIVAAILEDTQAEIEYAVNGLEAVRLFEQNPARYDAILMDVHMPEMDGMEATRRIRAMNCPQAGRVPIMAMTANVFREDIEQCIEAGMNGHIGKPIDFNELLLKLRKYLG